MRKPIFGVSVKVPHIPGCGQPQKMHRGLKFKKNEVLTVLSLQGKQRR